MEWESEGGEAACLDEQGRTGHVRQAPFWGFCFLRVSFLLFALTPVPLRKFILPPSPNPTSETTFDVATSVTTFGDIRSTR